MTISLGRRNGQAAVEMAISLVVVLPIVMYTLFLQEFLVYYLDWQESVVTPAWNALNYDYVPEHLHYAPFDPPDFDRSGLGVASQPTFYSPWAATWNYTDPVALRTQTVNQLRFCDHTVAWEAYDALGMDTADQAPPLANVDSCHGPAAALHHRALTAHECWDVPGAYEVTCRLEATVGRQVDPAFGQRFSPNGGLVSCSSALGVMNYFLPKKIFGWASEDALTDRTKLSGDGSTVHAAAGGAAAASWVLGGTAGAEERFGVIHDSWALNVMKNLDPRYAPAMGRAASPQNPSEPVNEHPFYKRVLHYYNEAGATVAQKNGLLRAVAFGSLVSTGDALVNGRIATDDPTGVGNDPRTPTIAYRRGSEVEPLSITDYAWTAASGYRVRFQKQNFSVENVDGDLDITTSIGTHWTGEYASGWSDPRQRAAWDNRYRTYWGVKWDEWGAY